MLIAADKLQVADRAALAAALLTERDPFRSRPQIRQSGVPCDLSEQLDRLERHSAGDSVEEIDRTAVKQIRRVSDQLLRGLQTERDEGREDSSDPDPTVDVRFRKALLTAYPDRIARRRSPDGDRGLMVGGRGVRLDRRSQVRQGDLFLCIDLDAGGSEAVVRSASAIEADWLAPESLRVVDEPFFDSQAAAVVLRRRHYVDDLMLRETPIGCRPSAAVATILVESARQYREQVFPQRDAEVGSFLVRARFVAEQMPELNLLLPNDRLLDQILVELCRDRTSFKQLREAPWLDHIRGAFDYEQLAAIDRHAPAKLELPSGNSIRLEYAEGKPPILKARVQELFGWRENPRIAGGRLAVQLHLLGPNYRTEQITEDLANFWSRTYAQVRKDLRRRYPKHHWPEDPLTAQATRNGLKPKP